MIQMYIKVAFFTILYIFYAEGSRNISCTINPGINTTAKYNILTNVVHIIAEGPDDTVHFIWSTYKLPSVIAARTTKDTILLINSTKLITFEKDAISFQNGTLLESIGVTFTKFLEMHYQNDSSEIKDALFAEDLAMDTFLWNDASERLRCSENHASLALNANNSEPVFSDKGSFEIQFSVSGDQEISFDFPHLVFTGNSSLLKFVFENLYSNASCARYGFEISLFSVLSQECEADWRKVETRSINDEYSPGVFEDVELLAPCSVVNKKSSFLSWRPVAYTGEKPNVANSSDVTLLNNPEPYPESNVQSIAELYFQGKSNMSAFNVTFGTLGDGCFVSTKYTSWSLMVGTGSMVEIPLSSVVIILASLGMGLLMLFLVAGFAFIVYRKCKDKDDDLLLN